MKIQILQFVSVKYTYLIFIYMQYDHHQNTTGRALASEVSVASYRIIQTNKFYSEFEKLIIELKMPVVRKW